MQASLVSLMTAHLDQTMPVTQLAIAITSVVFGLLHGVTPLSMYWAILAGSLLGK